MKVTRKLQKWGNSVAVRLPKEALDQLDLKEGQEVTVHVRQEGIVLSLQPDYRDITLADLLRDATPERVGGEYDWGVDKGEEIIDD